MNRRTFLLGAPDHLLGAHALGAAAFAWPYGAVSPRPQPVGGDASSRAIGSFRRFGAVGDGINDDTAAIKAAVADAMRNGDGIVRGGRGRFRLTDEIVLPAYCTLVGSGGTELVQSAQRKNVIVVAGDSVRVEGLRWRGLGGTASRDFLDSNGIVARRCRNLSVVNCWGSHTEGSGILLTGATDFLIEGNVFTDNVWGTHSSASDICVYGSPSARNVRGHVSSNRCLSNNSQGIYLNANDADSDITVLGNVCVALDADGSEVDASSLRRRHGIVCAYAGGLQGGRLVVEGNLCRNTTTTGIYFTSSQPRSSAAMIVGNRISKTGLVPVANQGAICLLAQGLGDIVANNIVEDVRHGPGIRVGSTLPSAEGSTLVIGNSIRACGGVGLSEAGILVTQEASDVTIESNSLLENVGFDIVVTANPSRQFGTHQVVSNSVFRKFDGTSVFIDLQHSEVELRITNNRFVGSGPRQTAVLWKHGRLTAVGNSIVRFERGMVSASYTPSGRHAEFPFIDFNHFRNCTDAICVGANDTGASQIFEGNTFVACTSSLTHGIATGPAFRAGYIGRRESTRLVVFDTSHPTLGTWLRGDVAEVLTQGPESLVRYVCVRGGTPGQWERS